MFGCVSNLTHTHFQMIMYLVQLVPLETQFLEPWLVVWFFTNFWQLFSSWPFLFLWLWVSRCICTKRNINIHSYWPVPNHRAILRWNKPGHGQVLFRSWRYTKGFRNGSCRDSNSLWKSGYHEICSSLPRDRRYDN